MSQAAVRGVILNQAGLVTPDRLQRFRDPLAWAVADQPARGEARRQQC